MSKSEQVFIGVGAVIFRGDEVLVIRRGKPPFKGQWSIPGGKLEHGEHLKDAVRREVAEETGVEIEIIALLDVFDAPPRENDGDFTQHMVIIDYVAEWRAGEPVAGDDAEEAEFVPVEEAISRLSWDVTRQAIRRAVDIRNVFHRRS